MALVPNIRDGDWTGVRKAIQQISSTKLGPIADVRHNSLTLTELTGSRLIDTTSADRLQSVSDLTTYIAGTANEINVTDDGAGGVIIGIVDPLIVAKGGTGLATLTDHSLLVGTGTDAVTLLGVATNGQLPIGSTGADPVLAALTGTANQITVTNGAGSITLSTPQDFHTSATPTFDKLTLSAGAVDNIAINLGGIGGFYADNGNGTICVAVDGVNMITIDDTPASPQLTIAGDVNLDTTMTLASGSITDSIGAISFGDETLATTNTITGSAIYTGEGAVDAPSHSFIGHTDCGMYIDGEDTLYLSTVGVCRLSIDTTTYNFQDGNISTTGSITANSFVTASDIGIAADTDLLQLTSALLTVNGNLTFSGAATTIKYGAGGVVDQITVEGQGMTLNALTLSADAHSNTMSLLLTSSVAGWTATEQLNFTSTNSNITFSATTAGKYIGFTSPEFKFGFGNIIMDYTGTEALLVRKLSDGGDVFTVDTTNSDVEVNGDFNVTGVIKIDGTQVITNQQSHIADASTQDLAGSDTIDETKLESDLSGIVSTVNSILSTLETHGLVASS